MDKSLTHIDEDGRARMVDITGKATTVRTATASGRVQCTRETFDIIQKAGVQKGDIAAVAELAGIMGAKRTADLIPLCHPLPLSGISVDVVSDPETASFVVTTNVRTSGKTGVEMEALTAVTTACLTIYDMAKGVDKSMVITDIKLIEKAGGSSGNFQRDES